MVRLIIIITSSDQLLCIISTSTDSDYIKFVRLNLYVSHCRHVCNGCYTNNTANFIFRYVHDASPCQYHIHSFTDLLVTGMKLKRNSRGRHILQETLSLIKTTYFSKIFYDTKFQGVI